MKAILALALLGFSISFCSLPKFNRNDNENNANNSNNSNNANSESSPKDKFIGTWEHRAGEHAAVVTLTIKRDDTYSIRRENPGGPEAKTATGKYSVRDDRLYLDGEVGGEVKQGFALDGKRLKAVTDDSKETIYFDKK